MTDLGVLSSCKETGYIQLVFSLIETWALSTIEERSLHFSSSLDWTMWRDSSCRKSALNNALSKWLKYPYWMSSCLWAYYKTRNTRTRNYGTRNNGGTPEHWWNTGTLAEQQNTSRTIGIPQISETCKKQRNNVTIKQHQEILPIQTDNILNR